jgi:type IV secretion system protein VirB4
VLEAALTLATKSVRDKKADHGILLARNLPYVSVVDDRTLMLRDGDIMASFAVEGINADTIDERQIAEVSNTFSRLIAQQKNDIAFYIHRISAETRPSMKPVEGSDFNIEIDRRWQEHLRTIGLRDRTTMITLTMRPPRIVGTLAKLVGGKHDYMRQEMKEHAARLDQVTAIFVETLAEAKPRRLTASGGEWLGLLRTIVDGSHAPLVPGTKFIPVADLIAGTNIKFHDDVFVVFGVSDATMRYGAMVTVKDYPSETFPGIFDRLNLPFDMVVTHSFTPTDNITAQEKIARVRRQMQAAEDAAVSLQVQLEQAEDDVASGRVVFGDHHCTVAVFCDTERELNEAMTFVSRAIQEAGGAMVREHFSARAAYFAQHPGNYSYRTRPSMISSQNFAELTALHGSSQGHLIEQSPWGDAVTIIPTGRGEPYRFNFHLPGKLNQRTVGHSLVLGQTGSGKTLGTAFLISQALRLNPRVIVFDKDNGFEMAIRAMGGSYSAVRMGEKTGFNPFRAESDGRGTAWFTDWLASLAAREGGQLSAIQIQALSDAVQGNAGADPVLQNFENFRTQLRSTDDNGDLYTRLGRWDENGQFGWLFGGKDWDPLKFDNKIVAFDMTEIFDNDLVRTAWMSYVFRRIERLVEDEYPTMIVLDEAWKMLDDPYFETRLKDWMLTMRKKNVAVILLTQRVSHIKNSAAGDAILESAVTRMIYPSSYNTEAELEPLNLTQNESAFLQTSNVGNHLVLLKSGQDSVVLDLDLGALEGAIEVLGGGRGEKAQPGWRDRPNFFEELM